MNERVILNSLAAGRALLHYDNERGLFLPNDWRWNKNVLVSQAGSIIANLLAGAPDGKSYKIGGMYMEFENNGGAAVSVPDEEDINREEGFDYLNGLTGGRDYLRVPALAISLSNTDEDIYPTSNKTTVYSQTQGTQGINGEDFNYVEQSRVYGLWLVAFRQFDDPSQDLFLARTYLPVDKQLIKTVDSQISATWEHTYG